MSQPSTKRWCESSWRNHSSPAHSFMISGARTPAPACFPGGVDVENLEDARPRTRAAETHPLRVASRRRTAVAPDNGLSPGTRRGWARVLDRGKLRLR